jgi:protoheme IX farnesyltransferase
VLAGAAAVDPALSATPVILAVVLFLWTPPHFWSLATVLHAQYRDAGVPMLPVVLGDRAAAWATLAHTVALALLSLLPGLYGMGPVYLAGATLGGGWFLWKSVLLVRDPGPAAAAANFRASLIQLTLLLLAASAGGGLCSGRRSGLGSRAGRGRGGGTEPGRDRPQPRRPQLPRCGQPGRALGGL